MTETPATTTYARVVLRESVHIGALTLAAKKDLEVKTEDNGNAYLTDSCKEKIWMVMGTEYGSGTSKKALVVRAEYGEHLADCMDQSTMHRGLFARPTIPTR